MGKNAAYQAQKAALGARSEEPPPPGTDTGTERTQKIQYTSMPSRASLMISNVNILQARTELTLAFTQRSGWPRDFRQPP